VGTDHGIGNGGGADRLSGLRHAAARKVLGGTCDAKRDYPGRSFFRAC
jgi:hypothetical protein